MGKPIILAENILEDADTLAATNTETDYDVANIVDRRPYTFWKATGFGTLYLTADLGAAVAADAFGIIGHNFGTAEAEITLQHSPDNANWTNALDAIEPETDKALMGVFTPVSKQYWRLKIVTASVTPYLAVLFIGSRLTFPRYVMGDYDPGPEEIQALSARSKCGYHLGSTIRYIKHTISVSFQNLTDTFIRDTFKPVWDTHMSQLKPFFWAWDIESYDEDIFYVSIPDSFSLNMPYNPVRRNINLQFEGIKE